MQPQVCCDDKCWSLSYQLTTWQYPHKCCWPGKQLRCSCRSLRFILVSIISIPGREEYNEIIMPQLSYSERTGVASQVSSLFDSKSVRKIIFWKMSRLGFKYSCQSSHLYIMPVKRGYKIDGRDQTSEGKQQVWQFFLHFYLQFESWRTIWSWGEKWVIICQYQADPASQPTIS